MKCLSNSIARKILMALTGLALIGFLALHLTGNLLIFKSAETFNHYSHTLISNPLIYIAEVILLIIFIGHFLSGFILTKQNKSARPEKYQKITWADYKSRRSISSYFMVFSGILILIFVPLHIWDFKYGTFYTSVQDAQIRDLHRLVLEEFKEPLEVIWYAFAMMGVGFHLWHGFGSTFESLGIRYRRGLRLFGQILALVIAGGFLLIPVIIYFKGGVL